MGLTIVDSGVVIGHFEATDAHHVAAGAELRRAIERGDRLVLPASAYAEVLVTPSRRGTGAVAAADAAIARLGIHIHVLDQLVGRSAARLRAKHRALKLPDALVIATAVALDADTLLTTDRRWPTRSSLGLRATVTHL